MSNTECSMPNAEVGGPPAGARRPYDLEDRLIRFALQIMDVVDALPATRVGNHIGGQLIACGTSPAANYGEAQSAESRNDFVHKLKIILKELRESRVWLTMVDRRRLVAGGKLTSATMAECGELIAIFAKSVGTARKNQRER
jgi:four helix bundle protein